MTGFSSCRAVQTCVIVYCCSHAYLYVDWMPVCTTCMTRHISCWALEVYAVQVVCSLCQSMLVQHMTCITDFFSCHFVEVNYLRVGGSPLDSMLVLTYNLYNWFLQLPLVLKCLFLHVVYHIVVGLLVATCMTSHSSCHCLEVKT